MYLCGPTIEADEIILTRPAALAVYWAVFFACAQLFVRGYEEPYLRHQCVQSYERYANDRTLAAASLNYQAESRWCAAGGHRKFRVSDRRRSS